MKLRKDRIFIALSIVFLCTLISIYTYRLIHYYNIENNKNGEVNNDKGYLYKKIIASQNITDMTNGLFESEGEYIFRGNANDNYVLYENILYRIIKIDKSNNIKLISEDTLTSLVWGYDSEYASSYIKSWLNTKFANNINNDDLTNSETCIDKIDNINEYLCNNKYKEDKVVLLSMSEYVNAGGSSGFLNNKKYFWLSNTDSENKAWFITESGGLNNVVNVNDTYKLYGVRPVITIKGEIESSLGTGTKDSPYVISKGIPSLLGEASTGSYIKFGSETYRIVAKDEENVKVAMNNYLMDKNNGYLYKKYAKLSSDYDVKDKESIGYYLNNTFYNSLENKDYIVTADWLIGEYSIENKYDYNYQNIIKTKVGLLNIGDLFLNDLSEVFTMTKTNSIDDTIYTAFNNGISSAGLINEELRVRVAFNLNATLTITAGEGTIDKPYEISK